MPERYVTLTAVSNLLERSEDRILEGIEYGEWPSIWSGRQQVIPSWAIPPRRQVSEEEG